MTQEPPSQGLVAGKYQLVRMIGRGGMGSVWEARHVTLGTSSAIKFIEAEYADSQEARSRFDKEAKAAATIQSKHAIQIFDHGLTDDGKPYIVMELLQGEPLDKAIDRQRLTLPETARILQQVCRGLARAHERGIVHRDLKPENIYLVRTPDEDEAVAKVLDFGIAKMQGTSGASGGLTSSTKTGAVLGTPFYMSPEQARGLRNVDHRADVWSLGVIAFKCLTGKLPFDGESVGDLLVKICTAPVPVPSHLYPGIPPNFDAWFMRSLEREPERRFATVTEQADALCFAAGIATRAQGAGSHVGTALTPSGGNVGTLAASAGAPGYPAASPNYGSNPYLSGGSSPQAAHGSHPGNAFQPSGGIGMTPAPGAMTNAPFTSESIPGVGSGRGKLVFGMVAGLVVVTAGVVGVLTLRSRSLHLETTQAAGISSPAVSGVAAATATADKPAEPPPAATPEPSPIASPALPAAGAGTPAAKTTGSPRTVPNPPRTAGIKPSPPTPTTAAPSPPPLPTPSPTTKKTNKNDPGY